ncbi:MAG: FeoA family protein [Parasphingorhabdus sp.]
MESRVITISQTLDQWPMKQAAVVMTINWSTMSDAEGARLRALGLEEGVSVERLHKGMFGLNDPLAIKVGRMKIAVRKAHASAIVVEAITE